MAGEREEMALVGTLTMQMLAHYVHDELPQCIRDQRTALERAEIHVLEDRALKDRVADARTAAPQPTAA
jgi:asparagine synthase (glutamine-hydrolysing)